MKLSLVTFVLDTVLCVIDALRKTDFYLDCSGAVLGPWYTTTAVSLAVGACSDLSASRLLLSLPPARLRLDPLRCPVPVIRIVLVSYFIVACFAKISRILPNIFPAF
jgi:hypothetical protein